MKELNALTSKQELIGSLILILHLSSLCALKLRKCLGLILTLPTKLKLARHKMF